jgi:hypothetical protein
MPANRHVLGLAVATGHSGDQAKIKHRFENGGGLALR